MTSFTLDVAIIMLGMNDCSNVTPDQFESHLKENITNLKESNPNVVIVLRTPNTVTGRSNMMEMVGKVRKVAQEQDLILADHAQNWEDAVTLRAVYTVDKSGLAKKVEDLNKISNTEQLYTAASFVALTKAIDDAQAVLDNNEATVENVKEALAALNNAQGNLVSTLAVTFIIDDKTTTQRVEPGVSKETVTVPELTPREGYTVAWDKELPDTITEAITLRAVYTVDKSGLQKKVDEYSAVSNGDHTYTSGSFKELTDALTSARTVLGNAVATANHICSASSALDTAKNGLVSTIVITFAVDGVRTAVKADPGVQTSTLAPNTDKDGYTFKGWTLAYAGSGSNW